MLKALIIVFTIRIPNSPAKLLSQRCSKNPSIANQFLVEDAINRIISQGKSDSATEKIVDEARSYIIKKPKSNLF